MAGRLERVPQGRMIAGVCTGIARYLNMDVALVRIITACIVLFTGVGPLLYLIAWLAMPQQNAAQSGLDSLIGQARQWNASNNSPTQPNRTAQPTETFDLYRDQH